MTYWNSSKSTLRHFTTCGPLGDNSEKAQFSLYLGNCEEQYHRAKELCLKEVREARTHWIVWFENSLQLVSCICWYIVSICLKNSYWLHPYIFIHCDWHFHFPFIAICLHVASVAPLLEFGLWGTVK